MLDLESKKLLPPNASQLEVDVISVITGKINRIYADIKVLTGAKTTNPHPSMIPWIVKEYGFGSVSGFIPDNDSYVSEGIKWVKERGTPAAVDRAFNWIFRQDELLENTKYWHWTVVEVRITQALPSLDIIKDIVYLVRESLPARAKLLRVWSGTDLPMFVLNESELNNCRLNVPGGDWDEDLELWLYLNNKDDVILTSGASTVQVFSEVLNNVTLRQYPRMNDLDFLNGRHGTIMTVSVPAFKSNHVSLPETGIMFYGLIDLSDEHNLDEITSHVAVY